MYFITEQIENLLFETLNRIWSANSLNKTLDILVEFSSKIALDRIIICSISLHKRDDWINEIYFVHGQWSEHKLMEDRDLYLKNCPITKQIFDHAKPFFWTKAKHHGKEYSIVKKINEFKDISGVQIPIFGRNGLEAAFSFAGKITDMSEEFKFVLQSIAIATYSKIIQFHNLDMSHDIQSRLSDREKEVLSWLSIGKKQSEIADILNISAKTVENHLRHIRQRLNVNTTYQALAEALSSQEISIPIV